MGTNADIKRFDAARAGQPLDLFGGAGSIAPVVAELIASPWIVRAADLTLPDGTCAPKRRHESIAVEWDGATRLPVAIVRNGIRRPIDAIVQIWAAERGWWDPGHGIARRYYRVLTGTGVYDIVFDRLAGSWSLVGVHD